MKKFIYGLLGIAAISLVGCDYNDPNDGKFGAEDSQAGWVGFKNDDDNPLFSAVTVPSNSTIVSEVPIVLNAPVNTDGLTINYVIEPVSGDVSYVTNGSLYLAKGELEGNIELPVTGDATCSVFNVVITSTSRDNVTIGFENNNIISHQFIVSPYDRDALIGTYNAVLTSGGQTNQLVMTVSAGEEENEIVLSNIFGAGPSSQATMVLNLDGTLTFTDPLDNYLFTENGIGDLYFYGDSGSYSVCVNNGTIDIDFALFEPVEGSLYGPYNMVLTKQ